MSRSRPGLDRGSTEASFLGDSVGGAQLERADQGEGKTKTGRLTPSPCWALSGATRKPCVVTLPLPSGNGHHPSPRAQTPGSR